MRAVEPTASRTGRAADPTASRIGRRSLVREAVAISWARQLQFWAILVIGIASTAIPIVVGLQAIAARESAARVLAEPRLRTIVLTDPNFDLRPELLSRELVTMIASMPAMEQTVALGPVADIRASLGWPNSARVPMVDVLAIGSPTEPCDRVYFPSEEPPTSSTYHDAVAKSYLAVGAGSAEAVAGIGVSEHQAVRLVCDWEFARSSVLLASSADDIEELAAVLPALTGPRIAVEVSPEFATLQRQLLGGYSTLEQQLRILSMLGAGFLAGGIALVSANSQAKHYARRRALGVSRSDLGLMAVIQLVFPLLVGITVAGASLVLVSRFVGWTIDWVDLASVSYITLLLSIAASVPSVVLAARREPARLLRVP